MRSNKIIFNKSRKISLYQFIAVLFAFFSTGSSLINLIPSILLRNLISVVLLTMVLIALNYCSVNKNLFLYIFFMILISLYNNYTISHFNIITQNIVIYVVFVSAMLMCYLAYIRIDWISTYIKISIVMYCIYGALTIIFCFTPDFYKNHIITLFPYNASRLISWYNSGCMPGLTNHYSTNAMLLSVGIMILFARILFLKSKKVDYVLLAYMIIALILTRKRAHTVFVLMSVLIPYYYNVDKKLEKRILKIIRTIIFIIIIGFIAYKYFQPFQDLVERFVDFASSDNFTNNRVRWWKVAINNFKKHPILGIGWGQFYNLCGEVTGYYANTHNVYLQLLCETGIVGFCIYMFWMIKMYCGTIRIFKKYRNGVNGEKTYKEEMFLIGFSLMYQSFFLLYCFTGNPLYDKETMIPYFISCMICIYYSKYKVSNEEGRVL